MTKRFKKFCTVISILLIASFMLSSLYIIAEADHDCVGEGCHICQAVSVCLNAVSSVLLILAGLITTLLLKKTASFCAFSDVATAYKNNLIKLKVKLSI